VKARSTIAGCVAAAVLLAGSAFGLQAAIKHFQITIHKDAIYPPDGRVLTRLPKETASWRSIGADATLSKEIQEALGTDNFLSRKYVQKNGPEEKATVVEFHAAYYTGMIDTVPHVPDRCFVGGGMQIGNNLGDLPLALDRSAWRLDEDVPAHRKGHIYKVRVENPHSADDGLYPRLPRDPQDMKLRTMDFIQKSGEHMYAGYFFIANGGTVCRAEEVRLLAFDLNSKYAYYLKVQVTSLRNVNSGEELAAAAASLIGELLPDLMLCTPDWVDVEAGRYSPPDPGAPKR